MLELCDTTGVWNKNATITEAEAPLTQISWHSIGDKVLQIKPETW